MNRTVKKEKSPKKIGDADIKRIMMLPKELPGNVNDRIVQARKDLGMSQKETAAEMGIDSKKLSKIENGDIAVKEDFLVNYAETLHVSTDYLLGISDFRTRRNYKVEKLGFTEGAIRAIGESKVNMTILNMLLENPDFRIMLQEIHQYLEGLLAGKYSTINTITDFMMGMTEQGDNLSPGQKEEVREAIAGLGFTKTDSAEGERALLYNRFLGILSELPESYKKSIDRDPGETAADVRNAMEGIYSNLQKLKGQRQLSHVGIKDIVKATSTYLFGKLPFIRKSRPLLEEAIERAFEEVTET